jgi:hypothetical protein
VQLFRKNFFRCSTFELPDLRSQLVDVLAMFFRAAFAVKPVVLAPQFSGLLLQRPMLGLQPGGLVDSSRGG